jgi:hypothetical protein
MFQIMGNLDELQAFQFNDLTAGVTVMTHLEALFGIG